MSEGLVPINAKPDWSKVNYNNPWHTGTPTEDGEYVCTVKIYLRHESDVAPFSYDKLLYFKDGSITNCLIGEKFEIVRWRKIEPYKEKTE